MRFFIFKNAPSGADHTIVPERQGESIETRRAPGVSRQLAPFYCSLVLFRLATVTGATRRTLQGHTSNAITLTTSRFLCVGRRTIRRRRFRVHLGRRFRGALRTDETEPASALEDALRQIALAVLALKGGEHDVKRLFGGLEFGVRIERVLHKPQNVEHRLAHDVRRVFVAEDVRKRIVEAPLRFIEHRRIRIVDVRHQRKRRASDRLLSGRDRSRDNLSLGHYTTLTIFMNRPD